MLRVAIAIRVSQTIGVLLAVSSGNALIAQGTERPISLDLAQGEALYAQYCAVCHGANLEGQPDWRSRNADGIYPAPPHDETGHTWHHADQVLFDYTRLGGEELLALQGIDFASGMPGFGAELTDSEIWDVIGYIQSTWPPRIREAQSARTESETPRREN